MSGQAGEGSGPATGGDCTAKSWWWAPAHLGRRSKRLVRQYLGPPLEALGSVGSADGGTATQQDVARTDGEGEPSVQSLAERNAEWTVDRPGCSASDLSVGDTVTFGREITDEDVRLFAHSSGDTNPLHLDETFAEGTRFEGRIVHGTLLVGLVGAAIARLPGLAIPLSQDVDFLSPARPGESLTADCEIVEDVGEQTYRLRTRVTDEADEVVVDGEAVVIVDTVPPTDDPRES